MFHFRHWIAWIAIASAMVQMNSVRAAGSPPMQIRVYRVNPDYPTSTQPPTKSPREVLQENGIPFPDGSVAILDRILWRLTVRNTSENLEILDQFMDAAFLDAGPTVKLSITLIKGPTEAFNQIIKPNQGTSAKMELGESLLHLASQGKDGLSVENILSTASRSGQQVSLKSGREKHRVEKVESIEKTGHSVGFGDSHEGISLEIEPTVGIDNETIDLNVSLRSSSIKVGGLQRVPGNSNSLPAHQEADTALCQGELKTAVTMKRDKPALIGIWQDDTHPIIDNTPHSVAVVCTCQLIERKGGSVISNKLAAPMPEEAGLVEERTISVPLNFTPFESSSESLLAELEPYEGKAPAPKETAARLTAPGELRVKSTIEFL